MWVLVVLCTVAAFIVVVAAQMEVFSLRITQLIQFRRVTSDTS